MNIRDNLERIQSNTMRCYTMEKNFDASKNPIYIIRTKASLLFVIDSCKESLLFDVKER